ncbi:hypothetical protein TNCV_3882151 [Trichonephila clavipes]|nr:hypothetical protein TNCV_3882151 [Trichonephila clavipes]
MCECVLAKKARGLDQSFSVTSEDANAVAKRKIFNHRFIKPTIPELNCPRNVSSIVARLRTGYFRASRRLLETDHVILNLGQVTWTTPELAPLS